MIPLFAGLTAANLILLTMVFALGLFADATDPASKVYPIHMAMGIAAGLMVLFAHMAVFVYFMGTVKWLDAASIRAGVEPQRFTHPASRHKRLAFFLAMTAISIVMLTMFAGAGTDPTIDPGGSRLWPAEVHLIMACLTIAANVICAVGEYRLIKAQSDLMDAALIIVNNSDTNESRQA